MKWVNSSKIIILPRLIDRTFVVSIILYSPLELNINFYFTFLFEVHIFIVYYIWNQIINAKIIDEQLY